MRITVVGYGYWGPKIVRTLYGLSRVEEVTVVDPAAHARQTVREEWGDTVHVLPAVVDWRHTDALVVSCPAQYHLSWLKQAITHGLPCFVEKPCGTGLADLEALGEVASLIQVGYIYAYHPVFRWLREEGDRVLGETCCVQAYRTSLGPKVRHDLSVLEDYACHDVAMALLLWGMPTSVRGEQGVFLQPEIADAVTVNLWWEGGRWLNIYCSWYAPEKVRRWVLTGREKMAVWDDMQIEEGRLKVYDSGYIRVETEYVPYSRLIDRPNIPYQEPLRLELEAFVEACYGEKVSPCDLHLAKQVWQVMESI